MGQPTQPYKRSISGSVGAGVQSLFGNGGRRFYLLVHKVSSKYHKAGESQQIIVDEIELGRDPHCQVRFDETFVTVSRRHAAIVKEGDNWKLVQLSQTNSTYLQERFGKQYRSYGKIESVPKTSPAPLQNSPDRLVLRIAIMLWPWRLLFA